MTPGQFELALGRAVRGLRIGVLESVIEHADPDITRACRDALSALEKEGAEIVQVSIDLSPHASAIGFITIGLETYVELLDHQRQGWRGMAPDNLIMMSLFEAFHPANYVDAQCLRASLRAQCVPVFRAYDKEWECSGNAIFARLSF